MLPVTIYCKDGNSGNLSNNTYMYLNIHVKRQLFLAVLTKLTIIDRFE